MNLANIPNHLQSPPQKPPGFTATADSIVQETDFFLQGLLETHDRVSRQVTPEDARFDNVILPLVHGDNSRIHHGRTLDLYDLLSSDADVQEAASKARARLDQFALESGLRQDLYQLVGPVKTQLDNLDDESQHLVRQMCQSFVRSGTCLPLSAQDRLKEINARINTVKSEFKKNLLQSRTSGGVCFTHEELHGVPDDNLSRLPRGKVEDGDQDKLLVTSPALVMRHAKRGETRRRCEMESHNRIPQNVPLFKAVVVLRDEAARLLGYPSHAAFRIETKLARDPDTVNSFLQQLSSRLSITGKSEVEELRRVNDDNVYLWDLHYYQAMLREKEFSIDQKAVSEYFCLEPTVSGLLGIFEHLFGLTFVELSTSECGAWSDDVQLLGVWNSDRDNAFLGYLYLDMFERDAKAGIQSALNVVPGYRRQTGDYNYPVSVLIWNFSKPKPGHPKLMDHGQLVQLFHELGHGVHDMVSHTRYACFHGSCGTSVDFGEAPSQLLENWTWVPSQVQSLSRHYSYLSNEYYQMWQEEQGATARDQPPEKMPDDMIASLLRAKHVGTAITHLLTLALSIYDMTVHQAKSQQDVQNSNMSALYNQALRKTYPLQQPEGDEWGHNQTKLQHLISSDYDAGLYSYLFSRAYSADMFNTYFRHDPMSATEGRRFRQQVLEKGGSQDELKTMEDYLGRPLNMTGLYKELCYNEVREKENHCS
ncbi:peptidase family M3 domain-containing protein [Hirsutella rhossiliensis]|uniref:Peptidase family m3 domain-containing protein n=1 Tax=Hirsutella rhossiliensis TaxID=111463 RepID=A0A9P8SGI3_9HYPO|nr:peptidase family m3 domain-containing protein [Hirsutella rhossiliensis]KAH0961816.1 peptidase family m3 domain-containing protein [Hirsutella rhossiliensis]